MVKRIPKKISKAPIKPLRDPIMRPVSPAQLKGTREIEINKSRRSQVRNFVRKVEEAIALGDAKAAIAAMKAAAPGILRAAQRNVVHKNAVRKNIAKPRYEVVIPGSKAGLREPAEAKPIQERTVAWQKHGVRVAFLDRSYTALNRLSHNLSEEALAAAASAPTDMGAIARVLPEAILADNATRELDPFAAALARNAQHRDELISLAGGLLGAPEMAQQLGITRQGIDKRRLNKRLLAVKFGSDWRYPAFQFDERLPIEDFAAILKLLDDKSGWFALDFLMTPDSVLGDRTPIEALKLGGDAAEQAMRLAREQRSDGFS